MNYERFLRLHRTAAIIRELITEQGEDTTLAQALRHVEQQEHQALL